MELKIGNNLIGLNHPTYFIADIAANHDGDLDRAKMLCRLAKDSGANAAKFQNFSAPKIVSDYGFKRLKNDQLSHQAKWQKSVFEVYQDASIPHEWTPELKKYCDKIGIDYFSAPYDFEAIDMLEPYVPAYKIGSGEITWHEAIKRIAAKGKPVLLATGASNIGDVQKAVHEILKINQQLVLMQCNTNYTANQENFRHIHLRVLNMYAVMFPEVILGLSDHTHGHSTVLGAIALGARVIEKHFTDDIRREGPDHKFSMTPETWKEMVERARELELALGSNRKFITDNEKETVIIQRRCLRAARDIDKGEIISRDMVEILRPAPLGSLLPYELDKLIGKRAIVDIPRGKEFRWMNVG